MDAIRRAESSSSPAGLVLQGMGRVLFVGLFVASGIAKLVATSSVAPAIAGTGLPAPAVLTVIAGCFELAAAAAILASYRLAIVGPLLAGYCILTALLFHPFWSAAPALHQLQFAHFLKNMSLAGASLWFAGASIRADG
jgi:putative oxidoreductase